MDWTILFAAGAYVATISNVLMTPSKRQTRLLAYRIQDLETQHTNTRDRLAHHYTLLENQQAKTRELADDLYKRADLDGALAATIHKLEAELQDVNEAAGHTVKIIDGQTDAINALQAYLTQAGQAINQHTALIKELQTGVCLMQRQLLDNQDLN